MTKDDVLNRLLEQTCQGKVKWHLRGDGAESMFNLNLGPLYYTCEVDGVVLRMCEEGERVKLFVLGKTFAGLFWHTDNYPQLNELWERVNKQEHPEAILKKLGEALT